MLRHKTCKFRIYPTPSQVFRMGKWNSSLRFLWNLANEQRLMGYARPKGERVYPTAFDQGKELTELRKALPWLNDVPRHVCVQVLTDLDLAWQRCFKKVAKQPRWKKSGRDFFSFTEFDHAAWSLKGNLLRFPKLGKMPVNLHRPLEGKLKSCTLKRDGDQWFVTIRCEIECEPPTPKVEPIVGIDRGVTNTLADSDGNVAESPKFYTRARRKLARAQRALQRKQKGSKNQAKAKQRVAKVHQKIRRQREHFCHQLSSNYAKNQGTVVIEKLQIGNMVKANRGLARGILDQGWGIFSTQLKYKMAWSGGSVVEVNPAYSSQTCFCVSTCRQTPEMERDLVVYRLVMRITRI